MVLPKLISSSQSAVVEGRLLADNVLLCQELICGYERKMISPRCMMKMDIRKAYDSVQWSFLHKLLVSFGLSEAFVDRTITCVTCVSYSIDINGGLQGWIHGGRGL